MGIENHCRIDDYLGATPELSDIAQAGTSPSLDNCQVNISHEVPARFVSSGFCLACVVIDQAEPNFKL